MINSGEPFPGGNATGSNILSVELVAKRLGLLHDLAPPSSLIAVLVNPNFPPTEINVRELEAAAGMIARQIEIKRATNENEIDAAFAAISQIPTGALLVSSDPFFTSRRGQIVALAARLNSSDVRAARVRVSGRSHELWH